MGKRTPFALVLVGVATLAAPATSARELTFDERVQAQAAIERVYYAHQIGATGPFEDAVPRAVLEARVRTYLEQSAALEEFWHTPITAEMLERETERMARGTTMPERLRELFAALGDDPFLVQECLARQALAERLVRNFFAYDERIHGEARQEAERLQKSLAEGTLDSRTDHPRRSVVEVVSEKEPASAIAEPTGSSIGRRHRTTGIEVDPGQYARWRKDLPPRVGEVGPLRETAEAFAQRVVLEETPDRLEVATYAVPKSSWDAWWGEARDRFGAGPVRAVAKPWARLPGSLGGTGASATGDGSACVPDDTWDNGQLDDAPNQRYYHTAVWTGSEMIVWGGTGAWSGAEPGSLQNTGGRYDPATDTWRPTSTAGAPSPRKAHSAVWTGTAMVVWGGGTYDAVMLNDGGRYNPITDSWSPVSTLNAPAARQFHDAVWTGREMLVWGAVGGGGRYEPKTNTWRPITTVNAPGVRNAASVVWTSGGMVVWGGAEGFRNYVDTGARYDPDADQWTPTSTVDAPTARAGQAAVWTGSEMLVWSGFDGSSYPKTGSRYDPLTDRWTSTSTANAPTGRGDADAVWTGTEMVVWGGSDNSHTYDTGGRYDPATDTWLPTSTINAPWLRRYETAVWTGELMIVWGGDLTTGGATNSGSRYDPWADSWTPVTTTPSLRSYHTAVWTGSEMVVWGGADGTRYFDTGGRYDPATDDWRPTSTIDAPNGRTGHTAIWTGREMVVWGGSASGPVNTGGRYDPRTDRWTPTSTVQAPAPRFGPRLVWTGHEIVVWGGIVYDSLPADRGGRYDPAEDVWRPISTVDAPSVRAGDLAVWTGQEMLIWGGAEPSSGTWTYVNTGGRYDPRQDTWRPTSTLDVPSGRTGESMLWTGREMLVWGGRVNGSFPITGGRYDPATDRWTPMSTLGAPSGREWQTTVWTGREMLVWGGISYGQGGGPLNTGGRYDPVTDRWTPTSTLNASARYRHTAVWTGRSMIVWGGSLANWLHLNSGGRYFPDDSTDDDGDGLSECEGDCNDGLASASPGAPEICDGLDQDCNGAVDDTDADGDGYGVCSDCDDSDPSLYTGPAEVAAVWFAASKDTLAWTPVEWDGGESVAYDVVRGPIAGLPAGGQEAETCLARRHSLTWMEDASVPAPGAGYWYLVRAWAGCPGTYGDSSSGDPRVTTTCDP